MTGEDVLQRLFGAHRVELSTDTVGDIVACVTFRGVTQARFKAFFHAELREADGAEANLASLRQAMEDLLEFERNHDNALLVDK